MPRVLVIEDEALVRDVIHYELEGAGFLVNAASDGPTALSLAHRERPDAVVLDLKMPGMDGHEVLHRLKELDPRLPVFIFSARGDCAEVAWELGAADGCFAKSADFSPLIGALRRTVGAAQPRPLTPAALPPATAAGPPAEPRSLPWAG